jgi:hypothetical protein
VRRHLDADPGAIAMRVDQDWFPMVDTAANGGHIYQWTLGFHVSAFDVARKGDHAKVVDLLLKRARPLDRLLDALWCGDDARADAVLAADPQLDGFDALSFDAGEKVVNRSKEFAVLLVVTIETLTMPLQ